MNKVDEIRNFKFLGFEDYIAARTILLSNSQHRQGIALASTAIEKYLKAFLAYYGIKKNLHLDKYSTIVEQLTVAGEEGSAFVRTIDGNFLHLLGDVYKLRYFDNATPGLRSYSFCLSQVICELDFVSYLTETSLLESSRLADHFDRALNNSKHPIHKENYILAKKEKVDVMSRESPVYAILVVHSSSVQLEGNVWVEGLNYAGTIRTPVTQNIIPANPARGQKFEVTYSFDARSFKPEVHLVYPGPVSIAV